MSNNETVRQHFVPRVYLKHFGIKRKKNYKINALNKEDPSKIIFPSVNQVCVVNDLYTLTGETEEERQAIENFYSYELEAKYDEVYNILTDPTKKEITDDENDLIIKTVITLLYRNYKWISVFNSFLERVFEDAIQLCQSEGKDSFNFLGRNLTIHEKNASDLTKEHFQRNRESQVLTQLKVAYRLYEVRKKSGLFVTQLSDQDSSFLTSDNPVIISSSHKEFVVPFDPENVLMLPLDKDFLLYIMPLSDIIRVNYIARDTKKGTLAKMEALSSNFQQLQNCERFIFGRKRTINQLINQKENLEKVPVSDDKTKSYSEVLGQCKKYGII
ncbi:MAG TPA: hypothetical protein DEG32_16170 [Balneolaceae bacterium]|nr:hypothetical protein [Balneolaceae bacterium]